MKFRAHYCQLFWVERKILTVVTEHGFAPEGASKCAATVSIGFPGFPAIVLFIRQNDSGSRWVIINLTLFKTFRKLFNNSATLIDKVPKNFFKENISVSAQTLNDPGYDPLKIPK